MVDGEDFYIDLLVFHIPTSRYVVIDLKLDKFRPKDAGQINFYVNVVDDQLRLEHHAPTIGLVLCATRSETIVRYALDGINKPVGVAAWEIPAHNKTLLDRVPVEQQLPSVEQLREGFELIVDERSWDPEAFKGPHGRAFIVEEPEIVAAIRRATHRIAFKVGDWQRELKPDPLVRTFVEDCVARRKIDPEAVRWFD